MATNMAEGVVEVSRKGPWCHGRELGVESSGKVGIFRGTCFSTYVWINTKTDGKKTSKVIYITSKGFAY
jgi:hypothetical protein